MPRSYLDPPVPIVALATPPGLSALALIRASGRGCVELLAPIFSRPKTLLAAPGNSLVHGELRDPRSGEALDEVLLAVFRAPRSPTGEDQVEISCHGSPLVARRLLSALEAVGFSPALRGEFSLRGFANGKGDLVRAEAVNELIAARSEGARAAALGRLEGGLSRRLEAARAGLLTLLAEAEVRLDYAEEDGSPQTLFPRDGLLKLRAELAALGESWKAGRIYGEGATLVLAGRANAGKSSLFNFLLREERALVSPEAGTTRDWIEAGLEIGGFPLRAIDTAGLRPGSGGVEALGIEKSRALVVEADILCCLVDSTLGLGAEDEELLALRPDALRLWTKVDLETALPAPEGWLPLSVQSGRGLQGLLAGLDGALRKKAGLEDEDGREGGETNVTGEVGVDQAGKAQAARQTALIANLRQKELLERAVAALDSGLVLLAASSEGANEWLDAAVLDLRDAADALGEITGEITTPEILETIFSGFCLGK